MRLLVLLEMSKAGFEWILRPIGHYYYSEKVKFTCKVFRTEHAQFPGYPLDKDHCLLFSFGIIPKLRIWGLYIKVCISNKRYFM